MEPLPNDYTGVDDLKRLWQSQMDTNTPTFFTLNDEAIIAHIRTLSQNQDEQTASRSTDDRHRSGSVFWLQAWFQSWFWALLPFFNRIFERVQPMKTLLAILQNRTMFIRSIFTTHDLARRAVELLAISFVSFFLYGFVLGLQHSVVQGFAAAFKLPLLFLLTIVITFPTLFIFGSLLGTGRSFMQTVVILLAGTTIISLVLVALAPVTLLFGMTTSSYQFFKLLNVGIFIVAWFLGAAFFRAIYASATEAMEREATHDGETSEAVESESGDEHYRENREKVQVYFVRFWFLLYGFVATQIAWMLRPFVCSSSLEFELFRGMRDNVYSDILHSIAHILGFR